MSYELSEIKKIRKQLGLTQSQLAKRANVSQSIIAKIEAGKIDPTFTKTKMIFQALNDLEKKEEVKADEVMNKKIVSLGPGEDVKSAISKMKKFEISQMPVIEDHKSVGLISESILLEALMEGKSHKVRDIMQDAPPIVSKKASISMVSNVLRHYPMVLVSDSGKLIGLITKADLLDKLYN